MDYSTHYHIPNYKILDQSNFKTHADDRIDITKILKLGLGRAESIFGKGENVGYQSFSFFSKCFQKAPTAGLFEVKIVL